MATRVVVDDNASDDVILEKAKPNFIHKVNNELFENLVSIEDDPECPYEEPKMILGRQEAIDNLVDERIRKVRLEIEKFNDDDKLVNVFRYGVEGFESLSNAELIAECKKVFGTDIIIDGFECWSL